MIKIKVPASSGNLSVGFDALSIALDLYNEYLIEEASEFELVGFSSEFSEKNNLVLTSYLAFSQEYLSFNNILPVKITLLKQDVPISRGLGSSGNCIIAGVIAANYINKLNKTFLECASFASTLEGHPDNVFGSIFGKLTASFIKDKGFDFNTFPIAENLVFTLLIPQNKGKTETLRSILPAKVLLEDAVFHLSRMIHVPVAFKTGDIDLLQEVLQDRIHESYRSKSIPLFEQVKSFCLKNKIICCISGSGPTLLLIANHQIKNQLKEFKTKFNILELKISSGVKIEVK